MCSPVCEYVPLNKTEPRAFADELLKQMGDIGIFKGVF